MSTDELEQPTSLSNTRLAEHEKLQRRVQEICKAVLKHVAELEELAEELIGMGCGCGRKNPGEPHDESCPHAVARSARDLAGTVREVPAPAHNDIRHLTDPFRRPDDGS